MLRRLPPLNALKAFEAAARHESFTRAAEELLVRQGRCQSSGQGAGDNFAAKWLVNRLGHFLEAHPEIDLRVSATMHHVDFAREDADVAVRHGEGNWPGLDAVRLSPEELFPVCSPKLMLGPRAIREPADLLKHPLLHMEDRQNWARWLEAAGIRDTGAVHGPVLNRASMLIDAAVDGQGIALARTTLAAWDLINGRLVRPFRTAVPLSKTYWIVCPKATASLPKIVAFRDWLLTEAAEDAARLKTVAQPAPGRTPSARRGATKTSVGAG